MARSDQVARRVTCPRAPARGGWCGRARGFARSHETFSCAHETRDTARASVLVHLIAGKQQSQGIGSTCLLVGVADLGFVHALASAASTTVEPTHTAPLRVDTTALTHQVRKPCSEVFEPFLRVLDLLPSAERRVLSCCTPARQTIAVHSSCLLYTRERTDPFHPVPLIRAHSPHSSPCVSQ